MRHADAKPGHLAPQQPLFPPQGALLAAQTLVSDLAVENLGSALAVGQLGQRIGEAVEGVERGSLGLGAAARLCGLGDAGGGGDAGDEGGVLDDALVALGGEEGVCCGGVWAERLLGGERVD